MGDTVLGSGRAGRDGAGPPGGGQHEGCRNSTDVFVDFYLTEHIPGGDLPSSAAISRALRLRSSILSTVFLSYLVSLPYDLPDGFGLDMSASLHRGPGDSGLSGVAYPDSRLRTQRNALR